MKNVLIIAHGSRRDESNAEIRTLAEKVAESMPFEIDHVDVAFLELSSPTIREAIDICFGRGIRELAVLPYFLSIGNHVVKDIPHEIDAAMSNWPDKKVTILPHIGGSDDMVKLITSNVETLQNCRKG